MYRIEYTNQIKKEIKLAQKRGLKMHLFKEVVSILEKDGKLPAQYKPHKLKGNSQVIGSAIYSPIGY